MLDRGPNDPDLEMMMKKLLLMFAFAMTLVGLSGCAPEPITVTQDTVIIDVRTSSEFAAGHLEGALNIDVQSSDFDARISELPVDGQYIIYCRSGNRSASAISRMTELGFTNLANGGGLSQASEATGIPVTTP